LRWNANVGKIERMRAPLRVLGCVITLTALFAPWAAAVPTVVHLAFDHHHDESPGTHQDVHEAATVLHGHGHEDGTPAHRHDSTAAMASSQAPIPHVTIHPAILAAASAALVAGGAVLDRLDPSPPPRVPIILRI
jgi:hypothetical protein